MMPFGLKNTTATHQRAMQTIFEEMLHKMAECYVNDLVVKSKKRLGHLQNPSQIFDQLQKC